MKINEAADTVGIAMLTQLELLKERKGVFTDEIKHLELELKNSKQESVNNDKKIEIMEKKLDKERCMYYDAHVECRCELEATPVPLYPLFLFCFP